METRHSVEGSFGSEFPAICNHRGVMAAWSRKTLKLFKEFFLLKTTPYGKFQNYVRKIFIVSPIDVLCSNFVQFGRREIGEIVRCLSDKNKLNFTTHYSCRH